MSSSSIPTNHPDVSKISEELYKKNLEIHRALEQSKELTELLQEEKSKIEIILENIIDLVLFLDEKNTIIAVNKAFENEFKLPKEDVIGSKFSDVVKIESGNTLIGIEDLIKLCTESKGATFISPIVRIKITKDFFGTIAIAYVNSEEGNKGTILTIHDKTKEHDLEDMKLDFVSMAAHELRTPITSIRGYASLLADDIDTGEKHEPEEWKALLARISISAEQLLTLVENLLNITKIEKGILTIATRPESWKTLLDETISNFKEIAENKNIQLTLEDLNPELNVYVDKTRITEVITNLVSNAINYTPPEGKVTVSAKLSQDGKWMETTVSDNGPGIPKKFQEHLFEKFFRVSGPLEQGSKGNGLGLYISKSIVLMHRGKIWVDSDANQGARFTFTVPCLPV
jgi:signal transduction histidine kinase